MDEFKPRTASFSGRLSVEADPDEAFHLFSPQGERSWVPGWDPEIVYPDRNGWQQGQVFRTREKGGEAVWVTSRLDRENHEVEYHRVEPGRHVAHIVVRCQSPARQRTEVSVTYSFAGLSENGNRDIAAMSQGDYDKKLERWTRWIREHLASNSSS